jgi:hypothetical protein
VEIHTKTGDTVTAACGDKLKPRINVIAVSRDLLKEEGIE